MMAKRKRRKPETIADLTEDTDRFDGLTLFRDPKTGMTKMLIAGDQINKEFIYFKHTMNGVVDAGAFTDRMVISLFSPLSADSTKSSLFARTRLTILTLTMRFSGI